jgi:hypothetical protein
MKAAYNQTLSYSLEEITNEVLTNGIWGIEHMYKFAMTLAKSDPRYIYLGEVMDEELEDGGYREEMKAFEIFEEYPYIGDKFVTEDKTVGNYRVITQDNRLRDLYMAIGSIGSFNDSPTCKAEFLGLDFEFKQCSMRVIKPTESYLQKTWKENADKVGTIFTGSVYTTWNALFS